MSSEQNKNNSLPSFEDLFLKTPLYNNFQVDRFDDFKVQDVKNFKGTIDAFCIECKKSSTFRRVDMNQREDEEYEDYHRSSHESNVFCVSFACTRNESHNMYFYFMVHDSLLADHDTVTKIGQYPSLADLNSDEIKKYRKILGDNKYNEFSKAIKLASHGIGIGSFVYLRRIFKNLIEEAHQEAIKTNSWNEDDYKKSRMDDKIGLLEDYLPDFLVTKKILYSILSKGIHELSEDECLKYFNTVKLGIEIILDEKLEKSDREAKIKAVEKSISEIHSELK